jgi:hypothetical protein
MDRRFSEEEMRAVFARAAERQRRAEVVDAGSGLSLAEMQEVAAAAGIDPTHVAAAVAELAAAPEPRNQFAGVPVQVTRVRRLPVQVSDEGWARIVAELRRTFDEDGIAGQLGRIREWNAVGRGPRRDLATRLALEPDGDGARVTLRQSARDFAFGFTLAGGIMTFMSLMFTTLASLGVDNELWIPAGIMGGMALLFLGSLQLGMRMWARRQERRFEALLDRIELIAREDAAGEPARERITPLGAATPAPATPVASPVAPTALPPAPALGLDALPDEVEREDAAASGRRTRA